MSCSIQEAAELSWRYPWQIGKSAAGREIPNKGAGYSRPSTFYRLFVRGIGGSVCCRRISGQSGAKWDRQRGVVNVEVCGTDGVIPNPVFVRFQAFEVVVPFVPQTLQQEGDEDRFLVTCFVEPHLPAANT